MTSLRHVSGVALFNYGRILPNTMLKLFFAIERIQERFRPKGLFLLKSFWVPTHAISASAANNCFISVWHCRFGRGQVLLTGSSHLVKNGLQTTILGSVRILTANMRICRFRTSLNEDYLSISLLVDWFKCVKKVIILMFWITKWIKVQADMKLLPVGFIR